MSAPRSRRVLVSGFERRAEARAVGRAAAAALRRLRCSRIGVEVTAVSRRDSAVLNRRFRGLARPADVLSFPAPGSEPGGEAGSVVICPRVIRCRVGASRGGVRTRMQELTVHGVLHVLGYHHATPAAAGQMYAVQRAVMHALR